MVLIIRNSFYYHKRYELDIWGLARGCFDLENKYRKRYQHREVIIDSWENRMTVAQLGAVQATAFRFFELEDQFSRKRKRLMIFFYKLWEKRRSLSRKRGKKYIYRIDLATQPFFAKRKRIDKEPHLLVKLFYIVFNYIQLKRLFFEANRYQGFYEENVAYLLECRLCCVIYRTGFFSNMFSSINVVKTGLILINFTPRNLIYFKVQVGDLLVVSSYLKQLLYSRMILRLWKKAVFSSPPPFLFVSYKLFFAYMKRTPNLRELVFPVRLDLHSVVNYFGGKR